MREPRLGDIMVLAPRQFELTEHPFEAGETVYLGWPPQAGLALTVR